MVKHPTPRVIELFEDAYAVLDLYVWLARRFPNSFVQRELAEQRRSVYELLPLSTLPANVF